MIDTDEERAALVARLSDEELDVVLEIQALTKQADDIGGPGAIPLYERVLELAPWDEVSMLSIGVVHANAGDFPTAIRWIEEAARTNPDSDRVRQNLAAVRAVAR